MSEFQPLKDSAACYGLRYHLALPGDVYQSPGYAQCAQIGRSEGCTWLGGLTLLNVNSTNLVSDRFFLALQKSCELKAPRTLFHNRSF